MAIVGSGIVGTTLAYLLTRRGIAVDVFEKGGPYQYPPVTRFQQQAAYRYYQPDFEPASDVKRLTQSGDYHGDLNAERLMVVGGTATQWGAMTDRMDPTDFRVRSIHGFGADWPIAYDDLEPYYCRAEQLLGVAGSDIGDPFAAPRSEAYPLAPFELGYDTQRLSERLRSRGVTIRSSPQARTRSAYDGRPACANIGICGLCPLGARYFPNHHLQKAIDSKLCRLHSGASVRRVIMDGQGRARALLVRDNEGTRDVESAADVVVIAAGAIESARLLLLSAGAGYQDGVGNEGGQVGRNFLMHHIWAGHLDYNEPLFPDRSGPEMAQSRQFLRPPTRGRHGGVLVQIPSRPHIGFHPVDLSAAEDGPSVLQMLRPRVSCELVYFHAESCAHQAKAVTLGEQTDRFGDPVAHVRYSSTEWDHDTYRYASKLLRRIGTATGARELGLESEGAFVSGHHHMGTCRMGVGPDDSVVNAACRVHGTKNLYVVGGSVFAGCGAVHPTLTMVALAIRTAEHMLASVLATGSPVSAAK